MGTIVDTSKIIMAGMKRSRGKDTLDDQAGSSKQTKLSDHKDMEEKYTFFFGIKSPFSQFYPAMFSVDGQTYNCAEQYMMHQKARTFNDTEMAKQIMDTDDPKKQKSFGRQVKNFDASIWTNKSRDIVKAGNMAKFSQNKTLLEALLATDGTILVEAAPRDRLWGIGLGANNPKALKKANWRGKNWLGYALTDVREQLIKKDPEDSKVT